LKEAQPEPLAGSLPLAALPAVFALLPAVA
jgi:hypothetical protein